MADLAFPWCLFALHSLLVYPICGHVLWLPVLVSGPYVFLSMLVYRVGCEASLASRGSFALARVDLSFLDLLQSERRST